MKQIENKTERYYLPDEQKIMNMAESNTEQPRMDTPANIDLSDFKKPKQNLEYRAAVILFIGLVVVIIASVLLFIRSKMEVSGTQQNSWTKDYIVGNSTPTFSGSYKVLGCRNGEGCIEILLEQTSDDQELHIKITAVLYKGSSAVEAHTGTGNLHGKGSSCIINLPVYDSGYDSVTFLEEKS
ncbi:MAG: hypothetical protein K6A45_04165 [Lachnospiraceae bacterium]|nr:hypothetical protein [Lachnospiraceae bacterium]